MTAGEPPQPELHPGDTGDAVLHLQERLHALGFLAAPPDGHFGDDTVLALAAFAVSAGLDGPVAIVDLEVWAALAAAEHAAGLASAQPSGDRAWRWDGERWQYAAGAVGAAMAASAPSPADAGGQWVWDGTTWQPVT